MLPAASPPPPPPAHRSMTTNCIIEPRQSYKDRIFTTGEVGWSGVSHIDGKIGQTKDYSAVINKALVSRLVGWCGSGRRRGKVEAGMAVVECARRKRWVPTCPRKPLTCPLLSCSPAPPRPRRSCRASPRSRPRARPSL